MPDPISAPSETVSTTDLSSCDLEPIRVPGAVQPHGRLLVLDPATRRPAAFSDNWPPGALEAALAAFEARPLPELTPGAAPVSLGAWPLGAESWDVSVHRSDRHVFLELEPAEPAQGNEAPIYSLTRVFLPRLHDADSVERLAELAAVEMKRLTGFGRCLVYRFDDEGHGEVLAEAINFFNPGAIVIGGDIAEAHQQLLAGMREVAFGRSLPMATRDLRMACSQLGDRAGVVGTGIMVIEHILSPEAVDRVIQGEVAA